MKQRNKIREIVGHVVFFCVLSGFIWLAFKANEVKVSDNQKNILDSQGNVIVSIKECVELKRKQ